MRGMILAAGRGVRMGSLTDYTPKPLLRIGKKFLIDYSIEALKKAKIKDIVINVSYLHEQIIAAIGDGQKYGVNITYSMEEQALETGGGIFQALPLLGPDPFIVLSSDVISDYPLQTLPEHLKGLAHLVMVDNPDFKPEGDFNLQGNAVSCEPPCFLTYANIGVIHPKLFAECVPGKFGLGKILKNKAKQNLITGERFQGFWHNLGTPEQLTALTSSSLIL